MKGVQLFRSLMGLCGLVVCAGVLAADFPSKAITVVIPYAAGGPTDQVAKPLVRAMSESLGVEIQLEYRGGEGATKGPAELLQEGGDSGHRILLHNIGMASAPSLYRHLRFDPVKDFDPIGLVADAPMLLMGRKDLPLTDAAGFPAFVRSRADELIMAYGGPGGAGQLCGLMLEAALRVKLLWVPYTGTGPALADLQRGRADLLCDQTTHAMKPIASGAVRPYALAMDKRLGVLPDVPTTTELGLATVQIAVWHGLYAVRGTPPAAIERLSRALAEAVASPHYIAAMRQAGVVPATSEQATPPALRAHLAREIARWRPLIVKNGQFAD